MNDGLAVPMARRRARSTRSLPLREALPLIAVFLLLRIVMAADMGMAGYMQKAHALSHGTVVEQWIAKAMPLDPVSKQAAEGLSTILAFVKGR